MQNKFCGGEYHTQIQLTQIRPRDYGDINPRLKWHHDTAQCERWQTGKWGSRAESLVMAAGHMSKVGMDQHAAAVYCPDAQVSQRAT